MGKAAAAAAARADPLAVPWLCSRVDDGRVRVRWRGDGAWLAVSSLETTPESDGARALRRVRIYSRVGEHSSTSEPVPGLEGALAWMPSGELIAATQRRIVAPVEGAEGDKEELRVVFFERNGLRRGEFDLREERADRARVREMEWSAGSEVLGVWIEREDEQGVKEHAGAFSALSVLPSPPFESSTDSRSPRAVQLWHRSNYHWYLKASLSPFLSSSSPSPSAPLLSPQSRGLAWHPEKPLSLALVALIGVETYALCWDTLRSERAAPLDDGTVAVIDGGALASGVELPP